MYLTGYANISEAQKNKNNSIFLHRYGIYFSGRSGQTTKFRLAITCGGL